jgi:ribosomal protein S18 acetylase RimI-like enzyme
MTTAPASLVVRRAAREDAAAIAELGARTFNETFAADNSPEDLAAYLADAFNPEKVAAELLDPRSTFLVAEAEGTPVGYAKLYRGEAHSSVKGPRPVELARLYASRDCLGRGVGAALMRVCLDEARRAGCATMWLGVWERNTRAIAFYRKWGFRETGNQTFQLGSDPQNDLVMELGL